ncbi:MAG: hypothetical protein R3223_05685, partial [Longimicrobiales bacterium]|nr:hypothetical protein [Longimicrobiales bacterium]
PLGFEVEAASGEASSLSVRVPGWRRYDVTREADLIEEVARTHGYDAFPAELGAYRPGTVPDHPLFVLEDELRDLLVGRGFLEGQVPAFAPESEGEVALSNPISAAESHLRSSLLPGLVRRVETNFARGVRHVRLFELGTCFFAPEVDGTGEDPGSRLPREESRLGLVATGSRRPPHWSGHGTVVDVWDLKGWLEEAGTVAFDGGSKVQPGIDGGGADPMGTALLDPELAFTLLSRKGDVVGWGGRVRSEAVEAPPWAEDLWALEIILPDEPAEREIPIHQEPSSFPGSDRDFALVIPDDTSVERVRKVIVEAGGTHLDRVEVFDLYRGDEIPSGTRSVAFRLHFSSRERTLTDEEVDRAAAAVVDQLEEELGVRPRS